jgi:plasmid stabilization system protein ParE
MSYDLLFSSEAEMDLQEAIAWYEEQRTDLGFEFSLRFEEALQFLSERPQMYAKIYQEVRSVLLNQFPYAIFYIINESNKEVRIFAVIHTSRNPEIWQLRTELL